MNKFNHTSCNNLYIIGNQLKYKRVKTRNQTQRFFKRFLTNIPFFYVIVSYNWVQLLCFTIVKLKVCYNRSVQLLLLHQVITKCFTTPLVLHFTQPQVIFTSYIFVLHPQTPNSTSQAKLDIYNYNITPHLTPEVYTTTRVSIHKITPNLIYNNFKR